MAEKNTKVEVAKETLENFSTDKIEKYLEYQERAEKAELENSKGILKYKLPPELKSTSQGITRGESKAFKKEHDLEIKHYATLPEDNQDDIVDYLLENREVKNQDSLGCGDIEMWISLIIGRTINPRVFEGN